MDTNDLLRIAPMSHAAHLPASPESRSNILNELPHANIASLSPTRTAGFKEIGDIRHRKFFHGEKWRYTRDRR
jgi:hypothetical protein